MPEVRKRSAVPFSLFMRGENEVNVASCLLVNSNSPGLWIIFAKCKQPFPSFSQRWNVSSTPSFNFTSSNKIICFGLNRSSAPIASGTVTLNGRGAAVYHRSKYGNVESRMHISSAKITQLQ